MQWRGSALACGSGLSARDPDTVARGLLAKLGIFGLGLVMVWAVIARMNALVGPFGFGWQQLGALYSLIARNYSRYGFTGTGLAGVLNAEPAAPASWRLYMHHPPGMGVTTSLLSDVMGQGPLPVKLLGVAFSLLQIAVMYALVARALSRRAGIAAAFATAVMPAGAYFATHGSELGPQAMSLALLAVLLDERARRRNPADPPSASVLGTLAFSVFFAWPALIVAGGIALRDLLGRRFRRSALFAGFPLVVLLLQFIHIRIATGSFSGGSGTSIVEASISHSVAGAAAFVGPYTADQILRRILGHINFLFGVSGVIASACGILLLLSLVVNRRWRERAGIRPSAWAVLLSLTLLAVGYSAPLARAVLVHRYWLLVALPLVSLLCGVLVHATGGSRIATCSWAIVGVLVGIDDTRTVIKQQLADRTPYYEELGVTLRDHVPSGQRVITSERFSPCLVFYAEREITGDVGDASLAKLTATGQEDLPVVSGWLAIVFPPISSADGRCEQLLSFMKQRRKPEELSLAKSGSTLFLFDLAAKEGENDALPPDHR